MKLSFVKGSGKHDRMVVHRDGGSESVDCPKQGIIPHDMVHYAVESTLQRRGFLRRVGDGEATAFRVPAEAESDGVERLVEVIQGDAWSGGTGDVAALLDLYALTCRARECAPLPLVAADIVAIRDRVAELDDAWKALPVGGALDLEL